MLLQTQQHNKEGGERGLKLHCCIKVFIALSVSVRDVG